MEAIAISRNELKKLIRETFIDVLTHRRDLIENAVTEAIEDIGLGVAIEEGRTGEYVDKAIFMGRLDHKIKGLR